MDSKSNIPLSFDPDAWEVSVVAYRPRNPLAISRRRGIKRQFQVTACRRTNGGEWLMRAKRLVQDRPTHQA